MLCVRAYTVSHMLPPDDPPPVKLMVAAAVASTDVPCLPPPPIKSPTVTWLRWRLIHGLHKRATVLGNLPLLVCAQLTHDLLAIATFLLIMLWENDELHEPFA